METKNEEKKVYEIKVVVKDFETNGKKWKKYLLVKEHGKLVDLRFKLGNDLTELNKYKKAKVTVGYLSDASDFYEYPRFYVDDIISIEGII